MKVLGFKPSAIFQKRKVFVNANFVDREKAVRFFNVPPFVGSGVRI
jgi:hypothetical protein